MLERLTAAHIASGIVAIVFCDFRWGSTNWGATNRTRVPQNSKSTSPVVATLCCLNANQAQNLLQENALRVEIDEAITENGFPSMIHAVDLEHILCSVTQPLSSR